MDELVEGEPLELYEDVPVLASFLRWENEQGLRDTIPKGRYIVEEAGPDTILLAAGDWDPQGRITFHSTKYHYKISGENEVNAFMEALKSEGPLEWMP